MKYLIALSLLCFGCRTLDKKIIQESSLKSFQNQSVIQPQYPIIGTFSYNQPIGQCCLQVSPDLVRWYDVPNEEVLVLPNGDWLISASQPYIIGPLGKMMPTTRFYRVKGI